MQLLRKVNIKQTNLSGKLKGGSRTARSSHQRCSIKKGVLGSFVKLSGKHLCQGLFFNKVAGLRSATLLKKRLGHRCFPVNFTKFLRIPFLQNTSGRLLLECCNIQNGALPAVNYYHKALHIESCSSPRFVSETLLMMSASAITQNRPTSAVWIRKKTQETYTQFIESLCQFIRPPLKLNLLMIGIINDGRLQTSVKVETRKYLKYKWCKHIFRKF